MQTKICKVVAQSEVVYVQSRKSETGQMAKSMVRLRELGGDYGDEYQCTLLGGIAEFRFEVGQIVLAALSFSTHESNGVFYQDIVANDIVILS